MRATISGTVQGVGFRWFTDRELSSLAVGGYVRNLADGRVEAMVEGSAERVERALAILRLGPPGAEVSSLKVEELPTQGYDGFEIRT